MIIKNDKELAALRRIGKICSDCVQHMASKMEPGMTTKELDDIGAAYLQSFGAESCPIVDYDFPGWTCISVNEEAAHGIPGPRVIRPGDFVNIDVSAKLDGFVGDTGSSFAVPPIDPIAPRLFAATRRGLDKAIAQVSEGRLINVIGKTIEREAMSSGFKVLRNLNGHGVGRSVHEQPDSIRAYDEPKDRRLLKEGMVITIEPFFTTGAEMTTTADDGWTLVTPKGTKLAQFEHTLVVTRGKPIVLTHL